MSQPKGYYKEKGVTHPVTYKHPHVRPLARGTQNLHVPKRQLKKLKRVKGFSKLTRVQNKEQGVYGHAIAHSKKYQQSVGKEQAKKEHDFLVTHYIENHETPL